MYKIISAGKIVALCDAPRYVTRNPDTGALVETTAEDAIGVSVAGTLYNLNGGSGIPDAPEAVVSEVEGGEMVFIAISQADAVSTTSGIAFVAMAEAGTIDGVTAGEHADLFSPWAYPVNYTVGQIRRYTDGKLYKCLQAHTSQADWTPDTAVSLWVSISDPAEEWPEWSQPLGAHDAYSKGAKVSHNGKHWISDLDANVCASRTGLISVSEASGTFSAEATLSISAISVVSSAKNHFFISRTPFYRQSFPLLRIVPDRFCFLF